MTPTNRLVSQNNEDPVQKQSDFVFFFLRLIAVPPVRYVSVKKPDEKDCAVRFASMHMLRKQGFNGLYGTILHGYKKARHSDHIGERKYPEKRSEHWPKLNLLIIEDLMLIYNVLIKIRKSWGNRKRPIFSEANFVREQKVK